MPVLTVTWPPPSTMKARLGLAVRRRRRTGVTGLEPLCMLQLSVSDCVITHHSLPSSVGCEDDMTTVSHHTMVVVVCRVVTHYRVVQTEQSFLSCPDPRVHLFFSFLLKDLNQGKVSQTVYCKS